MQNKISRRDSLAMLGSSVAMAVAPLNPFSEGGPGQPIRTSSNEQADRARRMKWWHEAKFGMFIHWGLYSVLGRHEWVMEVEGIPVSEYQMLAKQFTPKPNAARDWAKLAKQAGMKYMVMTTKHHEGFCLFDTKLTDYCAPKQAAGRELGCALGQASRGEGMGLGVFFSLLD